MGTFANYLTSASNPGMGTFANYLTSASTGSTQVPEHYIVQKTVSTPDTHVLVDECYCNSGIQFQYFLNTLCGTL